MPEPYRTGPKSTAIETLSRRAWLVGGCSVAVLAGLWWTSGGSAGDGPFEVSKSEDEWKRALSPAAFNVLRHHATERPYTSPLNNEKRQGTFACAGCDLPLFESSTKFESGTGWPSFFQPFDKENIWLKSDSSYGMQRVEVLCSRCDGHLGHVFDDGPSDKTGLRYCINGDVLTFQKSE